MAYCSRCGRFVEDTALTCAYCGQTQGVIDLRPEPPPGPATISSSTVVDDVPWWLGWLAIPLAILTAGVSLVVYPFWTYRRGRKDGVGREPIEPPYDDMVVTTVGWGLAHIVPFVGWYAAVHLPTLWYKHGLRVGAKRGTAPLRFTSLPAMSAAVGGAGVVIFVVAFVIAFVAALQSSEDLASKARQVYAAQAQQQATIDSLYQRCSRSWVDATARNVIEQTAGLIQLDDVNATVGEVTAHLTQFCRDSNIGTYCAAVASSVGDHAVRGLTPADREGFKNGCAERYQRDVAAQSAVRVGDCVAYTASSAVKTECTQPHDAQIIDIWEIPDASLPNLATIQRYGYEHCPSRVALYLYPTSETWAAGDRKIVCLDK